MQAQLGLRFVDLYVEFVDLLQAHGVDGVGGDIAGVSSEEFDFRTERFLKLRANRARPDVLFEQFRRARTPVATSSAA